MPGGQYYGGTICFYDNRQTCPHVPVDFGGLRGLEMFKMVYNSSVPSVILTKRKMNYTFRLLAILPFFNGTTRGDCYRDTLEPPWRLLAFKGEDTLGKAEAEILISQFIDNTRMVK